MARRCSPVPHSFVLQLGRCATGGTPVSPRWPLDAATVGWEGGAPAGPGQTVLGWPWAAAKEQPQLVLGWRGSSQYLLVTCFSDLGNFP